MNTEDRSTASPSPQEQVMGACVGMIQGRCVVAAAELGLPDALARGPLSVEAIAAKVKADADSVFRLMRALVPRRSGFDRLPGPTVKRGRPESEPVKFTATRY